MISFLICIAALVVGYLIYGKIVDGIFAPDDRETPAVRINDGVDYVPMPLWKVFLIQLLNIAGTGPIFGALSGALFGPVVYLWIVFGCIFAGAVHDYMSGMLSMRYDGDSPPELAGRFLGEKVRRIIRVVSLVLLIMTGVVFTLGPAGLLSIITPEGMDEEFWMILILTYYFIAAFVPVDKLIGRLYPVFGLCMLAMAFGVGGSLLLSDKFVMPELWNSFSNQHAQGTSVWPFMFITVSCGAISGFHSTQSPIMARCCPSEKQGRRIFYGAMIAEGIIAMIWAAAGVSVYESSQALLEAGGGCSAVVYEICRSTMGKTGYVLAMLGVIVCPISSGDTAYRSARLIIADWFDLNQAKLRLRLVVMVPLLIIGAIICQVDYSVIWRYCSWANQILAMIVLWTASVYLSENGKNYLITVIPAAFMTAVTTTYFFSAPECLGMLWSGLGIDSYYNIAVAAGIAAAVYLIVLFLRYRRSHCR